MAMIGDSVGYTMSDIIEIVQKCMDHKDFAALLTPIRKKQAPNSTAICDEISKLFFPAKPATVLFHNKKQQQSERPEAYIERKILL